MIVPSVTQPIEADWQWEVRELLPSGKHGQVLGKIRRQRIATSGPYLYAAWQGRGIVKLGEWERRQDARAAILEAVS